MSIILGHFEHRRCSSSNKSLKGHPLYPSSPFQRHPHAWGCKKTTSGAAVPRSKSGTGAALCLYRHAASNTCDHWPQAPYQACHLSCSILVNIRYNLRLCVVFTVSVSWWQRQRYGPSSPKRLKQQGRLPVNPSARRSGVKSSASVCSPFANPSQTKPAFQPLANATNYNNKTPQPFSPEEAIIVNWAWSLSLLGQQVTEIDWGSERLQIALKQPTQSISD